MPRKELSPEQKGQVVDWINRNFGWRKVADLAKSGIVSQHAGTGVYSCERDQDERVAVLFNEPTTVELQNGVTREGQPKNILLTDHTTMILMRQDGVFKVPKEEPVGEKPEGTEVE